MKFFIIIIIIKKKILQKNKNLIKKIPIAESPVEQAVEEHPEGPVNLYFMLILAVGILVSIYK